MHMGLNSSSTYRHNYTIIYHKRTHKQTNWQKSTLTKTKAMYENKL